MDSGQITVSCIDVNDSDHLKYYNNPSYDISTHKNDEMHAFICDQLLLIMLLFACSYVTSVVDPCFSNA